MTGVGIATMMTIVPTLAWKPLLEPMQLDDVWLVLLLPLVFIIALVYKTIRLNDLRRLWHQTAYMSAQILVFLVASAAVLWVITHTV